jgi:hypothetical protein
MNSFSGAFFIAGIARNPGNKKPGFPGLRCRSGHGQGWPWLLRIPPIPCAPTGRPFRVPLFRGPLKNSIKLFGKFVV